MSGFRNIRGFNIGNSIPYESVRKLIRPADHLQELGYIGQISYYEKNVNKRFIKIRIKKNIVLASALLSLTNLSSINQEKIEFYHHILFLKN